jgi:hypothetical protein
MEKACPSSDRAHCLLPVSRVSCSSACLSHLSLSLSLSQSHPRPRPRPRPRPPSPRPAPPAPRPRPVPVAHPLDLAPGSVRLNMGEFFSMSGMMRNLVGGA